jgi:transcriptional regulator with XRE-family HTH domain
MDELKSVSDLCLEHHLDAKQLAERAGLDEQRVQAIVLGRWTPSPSERDKIAAVFGRTRDQITWDTRRRSSTSTGTGLLERLAVWLTWRDSFRRLGIDLFQGDGNALV